MVDDGKDWFMSVKPRATYDGMEVTEGIKVRVIRSGGVDVSPDVHLTATGLNNGAKYFHNNSGDADSFTVSCLFNADEIMKTTRTFEGNSWGYVIDGDDGAYIDQVIDKGKYYVFAKDVRVIDLLDYYIKNAEPFFVVTRAVGIPENQLWLVTENKSRKQHFESGWVEWSLTFTRYLEYNYASFKNTNKAVTKALKKYKKNKAKKAKAKQVKAKNKTTTKSTLKKKCKPSNLKFSKTKKYSKCVEYMQKILYKGGHFKPNKKSQIDGWYGQTTKDALKRFQEKHKKKYKLKTNGNVDKNTFKALCEA